VAKANAEKKGIARLKIKFYVSVSGIVFAMRRVALAVVVKTILI
jgi:hypothetical protein